MSPSALLEPGVEAVFVPARPARTGRLAVWRPDGPRAPEATADTLEVAVPAGAGIRRRQVPVAWIPVDEAIDVLADLPASAPCGPSVHAWADATRDALGLVARGRVVPAADPDGHDSWRLGPLDPADAARRFLAAASLPPAAHAQVHEGERPVRVSSAQWLLDRFGDAVADAYVRTPAAATAAGHRAFAATTPSDVRTVLDWLRGASRGATTDVAVSLRLEEAPAPDPVDDETDEPDDEPGFVGVLQVASLVDPSLVLDAADLWVAPDAVARRVGDDAETAVLLALRRGSRCWPPLARLLDQPRPDRIALDGGEVADLLGPAADMLAGAGVEVLWPRDVLATVDLSPTVSTEAVGADREGGLTFASLCDLRWRAVVGGEELTATELDQLVEAKEGVVRLRGRWVRADPERLARIRERPRIPAGAALAAALGAPLVVDGEVVEATVEGGLATLAERLRGMGDRPPLDLPTGLHAELRPYQASGVAWLAEMAELGLGGVLADDMGLGKTLQLLALHLHRRETGPARPTLVVCPVSVLGTWAREAARFVPGVPVRRYHGAARSLADLPADGIVLTTYGVVRREAEALGAVTWGLVAADEAQAVKNPLSRTARALRRIPSGARFALTGTPVENRLVDLWALLDWTTPGLLGPLERFRRDVAGPIERRQDPAATDALARLVRPFLLRRKKSDPDIVPDLPPKTETDEIVGLTVEQATLYRATVSATMAEVAEATGMERRGLVLKLLTGLKQICSHPAHYLGQPGPLPGRSGKLDAATEILATVVDEGDAALVFTQYVAMGRLLEQHLATQGHRVAFLHGGVTVGRRQDMVDSFQAGDLDVLVISVKAGGTGLTLTRATHVVHFDRWWNPAVEDQASDRAWRIGQDRPVQVHRMVCEGTVEDRIADLLASKRSLADAVVTAGEGWVSELDDDALRALVDLSDPEA
ncbi:MAG TPA: DEAD/DEAH box helicase [Iamia sp.]